MMIRALVNLNADNLAHALAAIGIASVLRDVARIAWVDAAVPHPVLSFQASSAEIEASLRDGLDQLAHDLRAVGDAREIIATSEVRNRAARSKTTQRAVAEDDGKTSARLTVNSITVLVSDAQENAQASVLEVVAVLVNVAAARGGIIQNPGCQMGAKTRLDELTRLEGGLQVHVAALARNIGRQTPLLDVLSDVLLFEEGYPRSKTLRKVPADTMKTAFDYTTIFANVGVAQTQMSSSARRHALVELLAVEGLKAFPIIPGSWRQLNRAQQRSDRGDVTWQVPIWHSPLDYYEVEALVADSRFYGENADRAGRAYGIGQIWRYPIIENGGKWARYAGHGIRV